MDTYARMWFHTAVIAPAVAVVTVAVATGAYLALGGWMNPALTVVGVVVAAAYAACVAVRAGATGRVAAAWGATAAILAAIAVAAAWLAAFLIVLNTTCGSEGDCLG